MPPEIRCNTLIVDLDEPILKPADSTHVAPALRRLAAELRDNQIDLVYVTREEPSKFESEIKRLDLPIPSGIVASYSRTILRQVDGQLVLVDNTQPLDATAEATTGGVEDAAVPFAESVVAWIRSAGTDLDSMAVAASADQLTALAERDVRLIVLGDMHQPQRTRIYRERLATSPRPSASISRTLFFADSDGLEGLIEGCKWFELVPTDSVSADELGATPVSCDQTFFRVWAPKRREVAVEVNNVDPPRQHALTREDNGYFCGLVRGVGPGTRYEFRLDDELTRPDPVSRFQPRGIHGDSQVIDPRAFPWSDQSWRGISKRDLIIYEFHVGTFTEEGTFQAAIDRIEELVQLGVTAVEIMPVAQSPGRWNWGYDGVGLYAVRNTYGEPDEFKSFIDACHAAGIAVLLDVVYNHLGPEGNYLGDFGPYFSRKHRTPWGEAFNFDGRRSRHVRRFIVDNVLFWFDEYHLDGLRLDAVHFMFDDRDETIIDEIHSAVDQFEQQQGRQLHLIAEANLFDEKLLATVDKSGPAYDAIWCDCLMHSIYSHGIPDVRLTERRYHGGSDIAHSLEHGFVYAKAYMSDAGPTRPDGQNDAVRRKHLDSLVIALQTHDSVGNHPLGKRIHQLTSIEYQMAASALVMLYPAIPLLFMGEEYASDSYFPFFVDFEDIRLNKVVDNGRAREYPQHQWQGAISPSNRQAFFVAKCHRSEQQHGEVFRWYQCLLAWRRWGVECGWFRAANLSTHHDTNNHIHTLTYSGEDGEQLQLFVSLKPSGQDLPIREVAVTGQLILDSTNDVHANLPAAIESCPVVDKISLQENHAVAVFHKGR